MWTCGVCPAQVIYSISLAFATMSFSFACTNAHSQCNFNHCTIALLRYFVWNYKFWCDFSPPILLSLSKSKNSISLRAHFENSPCCAAQLRNVWHFLWHSVWITAQSAAHIHCQFNQNRIGAICNKLSFHISTTSTLWYGFNLQSHYSFSLAGKGSPFSMLDSVWLKIKQSISTHLIINFSKEKMISLCKSTRRFRKSNNFASQNRCILKRPQQMHVADIQFSVADGNL